MPHCTKPVTSGAVCAAKGAARKVPKHTATAAKVRVIILESWRNFAFPQLTYTSYLDVQLSERGCKEVSEKITQRLPYLRHNRS
jgi:hypothetical protein